MELEKRIDFTALAGRIGRLTEQDNPQRKTVFTLLDKVRDAILEARRSRNVSYYVLAKELTAAGLAVSEPTLRKYVRSQGVEKKTRKPAKALSQPAEKHPEPAADQTVNRKPAAATASVDPKQVPPVKQFNLNV